MMTELSIIAERSVNRDTKSAEQNRHQVVRLLCRPTPPGRAQTLLSCRDPTPWWQPSQPKDTAVGAAFSREKAKINMVLMRNCRHKRCWLTCKSDYWLLHFEFIWSPGKGITWGPHLKSGLPKWRRSTDSSCLEGFAACLKVSFK